MVLKWGFKTHFTRQNKTPSTADCSPLGMFEEWGYARCFPSTLGHLKYLHFSNNSLNTPFVFRLGRNGFGLRWCTPAATAAATRMSVNAPIKHLLNEGLWACLLPLHAWREYWNILMSLGSPTQEHISHQRLGSIWFNLLLLPFFHTSEVVIILRLRGNSPFICFIAR